MFPVLVAAVGALMAWENRGRRTCVLNCDTKQYVCAKDGEPVFTGNFHNVYIRLKAQKHGTRGMMGRTGQTYALIWERLLFIRPLCFVCLFASSLLYVFAFFYFCLLILFMFVTLCSCVYFCSLILFFYQIIFVSFCCCLLSFFCLQGLARCSTMLCSMATACVNRKLRVTPKTIGWACAASASRCLIAEYCEPPETEPSLVSCKQCDASLWRHTDVMTSFDDAPTSCFLIYCEK